MFVLGVAEDFGVEDEKSALQLADLTADFLAMRRQQTAALRCRFGAALAQRRVAQHFSDRHPGRFQTTEEFYPSQNRSVVVASAGRIAIGAGKQSNSLIIAKRMRGQSGPLRQRANLHQRFLRRTSSSLRV